MRQVIPFEKDIVFKSKIASITSISLEHEEKVFDGEVSGDFIIFGDYKMHADTTERELFKYRLPFTALLPDDLINDSISIDINNFTYEVIDGDVLRIKIDFVLEGELMENDVATLEDEFERFLEQKDNYESEEILEEAAYERDINITDIDDNFNVINEDNNVYNFENEEEHNISNDVNLEQDVSINENNIVNEIDEYIIYHIHIVQEGDTIDSIMKEYDVNMDDIKEYNDLSNIVIGSKIIIPELKNE